MEKYKDKSYTCEERCEDLMSRMTLREKVGQLNQRLYGFNIYERKGEHFTLTDEFKEEVERFSGLGVLYGLYRADPWAAKNYETGITSELAGEAYRTVQNYVVEHSRLGIPVMISTECPHGHQALDGALIPVNYALGHTFDPELVNKAYAEIGKQLSDQNVDFALMSVLDVLRDPRWGRSEECYSEDPFLSKKMASAAVSGMEAQGVYAVLKHLAAQGETTGGVNASAARIGERELREIHLQAIEECCRMKPQGVMAAYNEIDGVPCHANSKLLNDILRNEFGFDGTVMSDGCALNGISEMTGDLRSAAVAALKAGVDISLWDNAFPLLEEAVENGELSEEELDIHVRRVLLQKFRRGLFDMDFSDQDLPVGGVMGEVFKDILPDLFGNDKFVKGNFDLINKKLSQEIPVLLKNDGVLPITGKKKIAVVGKLADSAYSLLGDYTPPVRDGAVPTILQGLEIAKKNFGDAKKLDFVYVDSKEKLNDCFDAAIVVCGGSSSRFLGTTFDINGAAIVNGEMQSFDEIMGIETMDCGEGVDIGNLKMACDPKWILTYFKEKGIPSVTVVNAGRPYALEGIAELTDALIYAPYCGPMGGVSIAEKALGLENCTGRLSASIPENVGQLPVYYNHKRSYRAMCYKDMPGGPAFVFGDGKSLGSTEISDAKVTTSEEGVTVSYRANNLSKVFDDAVVAQVYISRFGTGVTERVKELKGFKRTNLEKKKSKQEEIFIPWREIAYLDEHMKPSLNFTGFSLRLCDRGETYYETELKIKDIL